MPRTSLTFKDIDAAWKDAQNASRRGAGDFYELVAEKLGLTERVLKQHFAHWNKMPHTEAVAIAKEYGADVRKSGFTAYLAWALGSRKAALERAWGKVIKG